VSYSMTLCVPRFIYFPLLPLLIEPLLTGVDRGSSFIINYKPKLEGLGALNSHEYEKGDKLFNKAVEYRGNKSNLTSPA